jgi:hypothetical protein
VKTRIAILVVAGAAGLGSSYALANGGKGGHHDADTQTSTTSCQRSGVFGTAGPQTFTVTVGNVGHDSTLVPGQVVTVTVGSSGQQVRFRSEGCLSGSTLTARSASLFAAPTSTSTTTTSTSTTSTTTTGHTITGTFPGGGHHHRHGHHGPGQTTTGTTTTNG